MCSGAGSGAAGSAGGTAPCARTHVLRIGRPSDRNRAVHRSPPGTLTGDVNQRRPGVVGVGSRPNLPRDDKIVYHALHALARQPEVAYGTRDSPQAVRSAASPEIRRTTGRPS